MNILILEDTNTFVEEFVDILKNNNLFADAHFFCLGDHFEEIDNTKDYQIIFIDVHLSKSINGIDFSIKLVFSKCSLNILKKIDMSSFKWSFLMK